MDSAYTLSTGLARAEHHTDYAMRNAGRVPPTLFLIGVEGAQMFIPETLKDENAKDDFGNMARLMCVAHAATACVMTLEAWAKFATPGEKFDETEMPSEAFARREVVVLMGESRDQQKQKFLPIIRTDVGGFFGFGECKEMGTEEMKGRFAGLLPPNIPDDQTREIAKAILRAKGIGSASA